MTKEEVIKAAWEKLISKSAALIISELDSNGWFFSTYTNKDAETMDVELSDIEIRHNSFRPKSLSGIETNNGWHRVEDGLPQEIAYYYIGKFYKNGKFHQFTPAYSAIGVEEEYSRGRITHWRKKEVYPAPIY